MPAVGKLLTHAAARWSAVRQARSIRTGIDGLRFLREFSPAGEVLERLRRTDPCMELRQCAVIDSSGRTACWTGERCLPRAGSIAGEQFCVQGNRLRAGGIGGGLRSLCRQRAAAAGGNA